MEYILIPTLIFLGWFLSSDGKSKLKYKHHLRNIDESDYNKTAREIVEKSLGSNLEECLYREDDRNKFFKNKQNEVVVVKPDTDNENIRSIFSANITGKIFEPNSNNAKQESLSKKLIKEFPDIPMESLMDLRFENKTPSKDAKKNLPDKFRNELWKPLKDD